jgi:transcriptional regulator with XRE-family HTH domain
MGRNQIFVAAFDYLNQIGRVGDQRELSQKTGISQTSISRIFNNHVRQPSEDSLRKLNSAFGNMFNMQWLRGEVSAPMLASVEEEQKFPAVLGEKEEEQKPEQMPAWASNFIDIFSKQVAEIENLRFELRQCLTEISDLKEQLKNQLKNQNN